MAEIVGREGHMTKDGQYVCDVVTVRVEDPSGVATLGRGPSEDEATADAKRAISAAKKELAEQESTRKELKEKLARLEVLEAKQRGRA